MFIDKEIKLERRRNDARNIQNPIYLDREVEGGIAYTIFLDGIYIGQIQRFEEGAGGVRFRWKTCNNEIYNLPEDCRFNKLREIDEWLAGVCRQALATEFTENGISAVKKQVDKMIPEALTTDYDASLIVELQRIGTIGNDYRVSVFVCGKHFESIGVDEGDKVHDLARRAAPAFHNRSAEQITTYIEDVRQYRVARVYDKSAQMANKIPAIYAADLHIHHLKPEAQTAACYDVPTAFLDFTESGVIRCLQRKHSGKVEVLTRTQTTASGIDSQRTDLRPFLEEVAADILAAYFEAHGDMDPEGLWSKVYGDGDTALAG